DRHRLPRSAAQAPSRARGRPARHRALGAPHPVVLPRAERPRRLRRPRVGPDVPAPRPVPPPHPDHRIQHYLTGANMSVTHSSNEDIIGRADINDIEAILSVSNTDVDEVEHIVKDNADAIFTWDYSLARPQLRKLYEKAKVGQWNATTDLPWDLEVDLEQVVSADQAAQQSGFTPDHYVGTVVEKWGPKEWLAFGIDQRRWTLSQFLHGEQGALLCTAKITETVPWYDAKLYASTQVV